MPWEKKGLIKKEKSLVPPVQAWVLGSFQCVFLEPFSMLQPFHSVLTRWALFSTTEQYSLHPVFLLFFKYLNLYFVFCL